MFNRVYFRVELSRLLLRLLSGEISITGLPSSIDVIIFWVVLRLLHYSLSLITAEVDGIYDVF